MIICQRYMKTSNAGRVTKGAAATILGTSYLYEKDYNTAMTYFDDVINNVNADYGYELVDDMSLLFTDEGEFNNESIFELSYTIDQRQDISVWANDVISQQLSLVSASNNGPLIPAWLINAYKNDELDPSDDRNYYEHETLGRTLRPVSLRTSAMTAIVNDTVSLFYGEITGAKVRLGRNGWGFGMYRKYTNHDIYEDGEGGGGNPRGSRASGRNVVINRLADVYLMQAECYIKTGDVSGDVSGALELMNSVRNRWALTLLGPENSKWAGSSFDLVDYDEQTLMERLMYIEKPLEMSIEGHQIRWNDLRRWGIIQDNYNRLSNATFYAKNVEVVNVEGRIIRKNSSSISEDPGTSTGLDVIDYEYDETVKNYNSSLHDYLPIPLSESMRNPNVN